MPSANGVYSLPPSYLAVTGTTIQASQHNPPLEDIAQALTNRLSRDGSAPMTGPVLLADGTVGAPSVTFQNAPNTGFYKTVNGFGIAIGGVKVGEFVAGGIKGARVIGELVPFTGRTAPPLFVFPVGQTLSRTAYPDLWTFAQAEITTGNPLYNNGNGSTTFGVCDLRGRVVAAVDNMGGISAGRFTPALGVGTGVEAATIATANLPPYTPSGAVTGTAFTGQARNFVLGAGADTLTLTNGTADGRSFTVSGTLNGNAQGGTSAPLTITQPTITTNYILYAGA